MKIISLDNGMRYCHDGDNTFPWYEKNEIVTLEGPTNKHSVVQVLVSILLFLIINFFLCVGALIYY